jgi:ferritin
MLDPKMQQAINKQINHEMAAAYNYLAMAAHFESQNLGGFASWMQEQRSEELVHAQKLIQYVLDRGGQVDLAAVAKPPTDYETPHAVFQHALKLEKLNTHTINELYELALELRDYATQSHLQWFIDEQVEEEKSMDDVISLLEIAKDNPSALLMLNEQLGARKTP